MKLGTVALIVRFEGSQVTLLETLSEDKEIELVEQAVKQGEPEPLKRVKQLRESQKAEDETFGDYVEQLLTQPFIRPEIRDHGLNWFYSKIRIERFKRNEEEAAKVIAEYALKLFQDAPDRQEFILAGPKSKVQVRVFSINKLEDETEAA